MIKLAISTLALGGVAAKLWHDRRDARRTVNLLRNVEHMLRAEAKAEAVVAEQNEKLLTGAENAARLANENREKAEASLAWQLKVRKYLEADAEHLEKQLELARKHRDKLAAQLKRLKARKV